VLRKKVSVISRDLPDEPWASGEW